MNVKQSNFEARMSTDTRGMKQIQKQRACSTYLFDKKEQEYIIKTTHIQKSTHAVYMNLLTNFQPPSQSQETPHMTDFKSSMQDKYHTNPLKSCEETILIGKQQWHTYLHAKQNQQYCQHKTRRNTHNAGDVEHPSHPILKTIVQQKSHNATFVKKKQDTLQKCADHKYHHSQRTEDNSNKDNNNKQET